MALDITVQLLIESHGGVTQWNNGVMFLRREEKKQQRRAAEKGNEFVKHSSPHRSVNYSNDQNPIRQKSYHYSPGILRWVVNFPHTYLECVVSNP